MGMSAISFSLNGPYSLKSVPIDIKSSFLESAVQRGIPIWSEVELAWTRRVGHIDGPEIAILPQHAGARCFAHLSADRLGQTDRDAGYMIELGRKPNP